MKQVIGIRTNGWTAAEERTYQRLQEAFLPEQIFVVIDETTAEVTVPAGVQKIGWNQDFMAHTGVLDYDHFGRGIGWLCGDYFYYAFHQAVAADYYWLIEPDVGMSFPSWSDDFFAKFESSQADGLFANLRLLPEGDYWYQSARLISDQAQGCSFPLNRLSSSAIQQCLQRASAVESAFLGQ